DYVERPAWRPQTRFEARGERLGHGVRDLLFRRR
ncbi:MAG: tRNA (guanosine(46)-N7)-methyltransferase TrmB, partial [Gammaproteobacteria bacterium]